MHSAAGNTPQNPGCAGKIISRCGWGSDRLGRSQLVDVASRKFKFGGTRQCIQDIEVVFTDDASEVEWEGLNPCELDKITLKYNRKTGDVSAETE